MRWPTAARRILVSRVIDAFSHEPGVREGCDPEAIHDMRVALRRLQVALRMFKACYPPKRLGRYRRQLRKLMTVLGAVRDHDIMIGALSDHAKGSPRPVQELLEQVAAQRRVVRKRDRTKALRMLDKLQRADFAKTLVGFVRSARECGGADSGARFAEGAAAAAQKAVMSWNDLRKKLRGSGDPETLHQIRIAVKRLRYTLELCRLANSQECQGYVERLARLQQMLGDLHDADMLVRVLAESLWAAPVEAIGGVADMIRITKQKGQDVAGGFSRLIGGRAWTVKPIPAIRDDVRHCQSRRGRQARVLT